MTNNNMIFVANWKMHGNFYDISKVKTVLNLIKNKKYKMVKIIYCPPFTLLKSFSNYFNNTKLNVGAQNCYYKSDYGPYTGNVNAKLIKSAGAKYIILGHSENRNEGETDLLINHKIKSVLKEKLSVIFCIGETIQEKKKKNTFQVLKRQISKGLKGIKNINKIIIENQQTKLYTVIDLYALFVNSKGQLRDNLTYDGLHLNEEGYKVWSNFIKPTIDSLKF